MTFRNRTLLFLGSCLAAALANAGLLRELIVFSLRHDYATHVLLIPFLSAALILRSRVRIFSGAGSSLPAGGLVACAGLAILLAGFRLSPRLAAAETLSLRVFAMAALVIGIFLICYGTESFRKALFPLLLLFLMVPIPDVLLQSVIFSLQKGTADGAAFLLTLTGTPYNRHDLLFVLPRISFQIAPQCSGIRSSLALFLSCLLAGHLMLDSSWRKLALVLLAIPVAMIKNAVRITVLALLAIHVDPRFLGGSELHQEGGILFFLLALLFMAPVFWLLRLPEARARKAAANSAAG